MNPLNLGMIPPARVRYTFVYIFLYVHILLTIQPVRAYTHHQTRHFNIFYQDKLTGVRRWRPTTDCCAVLGVFVDIMWSNTHQWRYCCYKVRLCSCYVQEVINHSKLLLTTFIYIGHNPTQSLKFPIFKVFLFVFTAVEAILCALHLIVLYSR
jgi:hypothetical protein